MADLVSTVWVNRTLYGPGNPPPPELWDQLPPEVWDEPPGEGKLDATPPPSGFGWMNEGGDGQHVSEAAESTAATITAHRTALLAELGGYTDVGDLLAFAELHGVKVSGDGHEPDTLRAAIAVAMGLAGT